MKISKEEQRAIRTVVDLGDQFGFGNLMSHLATAWAAHLMASGVSEKAARAATARDGSCYPFQMQTDLMERGEWDETGARYRQKRKRTSR